MSATIFAGLLVSAALALTPIHAFATASSATSVAASANETPNSGGAAVLKEMEVFANVQVSVRDAIVAAETQNSGAKVVDISFDGGSDRISYRVKTFRHNEIWTGAVDASTGGIIGEGVVTPVAKLDFKDKAELADFKSSGINLSEAVEIAEEYGAGTAVSAGLEKKDGRTVFAVVVVADGSLREVLVEMTH